jgi:hypothetical protein
MKRTALFLMVTACTSLVLLTTGCEDDDTDVPDENTFNTSSGDTSGRGTRDTTTSVDTGEEAEVVEEELSVSPTETTLESDGDMASFTASGGTAPYTWSVQDVFRGSVVDSGGASAAYQRSAAGDNAVIVEDATGEKSFAIVNQP